MSSNYRQNLQRAVNESPERNRCNQILSTTDELTIRGGDPYVKIDEVEPESCPTCMQENQESFVSNVKCRK